MWGWEREWGQRGGKGRTGAASAGVTVGCGVRVRPSATLYSVSYAGSTVHSAASSTPVGALGSEVTSRGVTDVSHRPTPMMSAVVLSLGVVDSPASRSGERLKASGIPCPSKTLYGRAGVPSSSPWSMSVTWNM